MIGASPERRQLEGGKLTGLTITIHASPQWSQRRVGVMLRRMSKTTLRLTLVACAAVSALFLAISTAPAGARTTKTAETRTCVIMVTKHQKVSAASISACEHSSLKVLHVCPKGFSTIFVIVNNRTYGYRLNSRPILLAKQYGMGAVTETCGYQNG